MKTLSRHLRIIAVVLTVIVLGASCESILGPGANLDSPLRTDGREFEVREDGTRWVAWIPVRYRNSTEDTTYLDNCNRQFSYVLEKWEGEWVHAWSPVINLCVSSPLTFPPGTVTEDTFPVVAISGSGYQFHVSEIGGTYRLVWPLRTSM